MHWTDSVFTWTLFCYHDYYYFLKPSVLNSLLLLLLFDACVTSKQDHEILHFSIRYWINVIYIQVDNQMSAAGVVWNTKTKAFTKQFFLSLETEKSLRKIIYCPTGHVCHWLSSALNKAASEMKSFFTVRKNTVSRSSTGTMPMHLPLSL